MTIGEVARQAGVRASTIRFYEQGGLLPGAIRSNGRRVYGESILELLEVIEFANRAGFVWTRSGGCFRARPIMRPSRCDGGRWFAPSWMN